MKFIQVTIVRVEGDGSENVGPWRIRADEVVGYGAVTAYDNPGRPNCRVDLRSSTPGGSLRKVYVKEHVSTIESALNNAISGSAS